MKEILSVLVFIFVTASFAFGQNGAVTSEKAILDVVDRLTKAGTERDVATIERLYTDDFLHANPNGTTMTRAQVLALYRSPPTETIESNTHDEDKVRVYGNSAIVTNRVTIKGHANNSRFEQIYRVTYFLRKRLGTWRISASHASMVLQ